MAHNTVPLVLGQGTSQRTFHLRFGAIGAYLLQQVTGEGILNFAGKVDSGTLGFMDLHALLFACLESARRKDHTPPMPWTIDSVGDLIDGECDGDLVMFWKMCQAPVVEAFKRSFHVSMQQQADMAERQAQARPAPEVPPEAASSSTGGTPNATGMTASTMPPKSRSRKPTSGA